MKKLIFFIALISSFAGINAQDRNYTDFSGIVNDGSGPDPYPGETSAWYCIKPTGAAFVQVVFTEFDLPTNNDGLRIYDGGDRNAPLIGEYYNDNPPPEIILSTGNALFFEFYSNTADPGQGWTVEYTGIVALPPHNTEVTYTYDDYGNRITRTITLDNPGIQNALKAQTYTNKPKAFEDSIGNDKIIISPNPTEGRISVEVQGSLKERALFVFDLSGKMIIAKKFSSSLEEIDLSPYSNGTYILKISDGTQVNEWKILKR
jgi:hypothetical protein